MRRLILFFILSAAAFGQCKPGFDPILGQITSCASATTVVAVNWRGAYAGGTSYVTNDGVSYNGSSYVALQNCPTCAQTPGIAPAYWQVVAAGAAAPSPYTVSIVSQTTTTVAASTHGQGANPVAFCFDSATPHNYVTCGYSVDSSGNVVFAWNPAFTGTIEIMAAGQGAVGTSVIASGAQDLSAAGAILSGACSAALTNTATGVTTSDSIIASFAGDPTGIVGFQPLVTGMLTVIPYPDAGGDLVDFKVCNNTALPITPGAIFVNWEVVR